MSAAQREYAALDALAGRWLMDYLISKYRYYCLSRYKGILYKAYMFCFLRLRFFAPGMDWARLYELPLSTPHTVIANPSSLLSFSPHSEGQDPMEWCSSAVDRPYEPSDSERAEKQRARR